MAKPLAGPGMSSLPIYLCPGYLYGCRLASADAVLLLSLPDPAFVPLLQHFFMRAAFPATRPLPLHSASGWRSPCNVEMIRPVFFQSVVACSVHRRWRLGQSNRSSADDAHRSQIPFSRLSLRILKARGRETNALGPPLPSTFSGHLGGPCWTSCFFAFCEDSPPLYPLLHGEILF